MSVASLSNTDMNKIFMEFVIPGLHVEIRKNSILYDRFDTNIKDIKGKHATFKCLTASTPGRPSSTSTLPTPVQSVINEFFLYVKRGYMDTMQFDGLALACGKGKGVVLGMVETELKGKTYAAANKMNKQMWGDGSGRLAQVVGAVTASTSVIVDGPLFGQSADFRTNPANYLFQNQYIDIYSSAGVLEVEGAQITAITDNGDGTATLTINRAVTCSNDAYIFDTDTYATTHAAGVGVPNGLMGILGTGAVYLGITAAYFQGVDRTAAANSWARTQYLNNSNAAVDETNVLRLIQDCEKWGRTKVLLTNEVIWRAWAAKMKTDHTLINKTTQWGGTAGIVFYGGREKEIPIISDADCPDKQIVALNDEAIHVYAPTRNGMDWIPGENGILRRVAGKDEVTAQMVYYYNLGCDNPQSLGLLYNVKHAAA